MRRFHIRRQSAHASDYVIALATYQQSEAEIITQHASRVHGINAGRVSVVCFTVVRNAQSTPSCPQSGALFLFLAYRQHPSTLPAVLTYPLSIFASTRSAVSALQSIPTRLLISCTKPGSPRQALPPLYVPSDLSVYHIKLTSDTVACRSP